MTNNQIDSDYFEWMCDKVYDADEDGGAYMKLLQHLHRREYTYVIEMDGNRAQDGLSLRRRFAYECGYSQKDVAYALIDRPCSVLEMMVALSIRCEDTIMYDPDYGDRTAELFWSMIKSLGLEDMRASRYNTRRVDDILDRFMSNNYDHDGTGGLFTIEDCREDLRNVEIWCQMNWYMDTILEGNEW